MNLGPRARVLPLLLIAACAGGRSGPDASDRVDVRPTARALGGLVGKQPVTTLGDARAAGILPARRIARTGRKVSSGAPRTVYFSPPTSIRVWRRALDGSTASCSGRVDVIPFEDYVKGVLPHEWIPSWQEASLQAGAIAIRSYAASWVAAGGKYTCADLDDTTASQVYKDDRNARASAAVDATSGVYVVRAGELVVAEYSAENGNPTADGVDEPLCDGQTVNGHGRGTCQWGTQRWAQAGKTADWIVLHYYPGAELVGQVPPLAASLTADVHEATMVSGDTMAVSLTYRNDGTLAWQPGEVSIGTTDPRDRDSAFASPDWASGSRPATVAAAVDPATTGTFAWTMTAPEVTSATVFTERFALVAADGTWFGPADDAVTWTITVTPRPGGPAAGGCDGCGAGGDGAGAIACAILGASALRRRRRSRRRAAR
ncbi:MAG: hypothetical protein K8W52_09315 [Deltaproteobacteria bacterium]|nr:hypothetical protein [Deltaproteobacteria bacterium]